MKVIDTLIHSIQEKQAPVVVGLDPVIEQIPSFLKTESLAKYGNTRQAVANVLWEFNKKLLDTLHTYIPCVKLQMACYEIYGSDGIAVFEKTIALAKQYNLTVIADGKRNDIGSTASMYAKAYLGNPTLLDKSEQENNIDFLTVNPFLGSDTIIPFIEEAKRTDKGIFVLVRTSNASAVEYQEATIQGQFLYEKIAQDLQQYASEVQGKEGYSLVGAVVGATWKEAQNKLRSLMPNVFFLIPGYGAQGATAKDITASFDVNGGGAIINASRSIIYAYKNKLYNPKLQEDLFAEASLVALKVMLEDINKAIQK